MVQPVNDNQPALPAKSAPYEHLDSAAREFRLIRLKTPIQDVGTGEIEFEIQVFRVGSADCPAYTALSYRWGEGKKSMIRLQGVPHAVRPNLYEYIKLMYREKHSNWIFIDAICVDQEDEQEKPGQIRLMGDIYRNCEHCIAWMGVDFVTWDPVRFHASSFESTIADLEQAIMTVEGVRKFIRDYYGIPIILAFFSLEYWSRVWILQEVILPRRLTLQFRHLSLSLELAKLFLSEMVLPLSQQKRKRQRQERRLWCLTTDLIPVRSRKPILGKGESAYVTPAMITRMIHTPSMVKMILKDRREIHTNADDVPSMPLHRALCLSGGQQCTKLYDQIYGLLGLTRSQITIDYSMPKSELYLQALLESLEELALMSKAAQILDAGSQGQQLLSEVSSWNINNLDRSILPLRDKSILGLVGLSRLSNLLDSLWVGLDLSPWDTSVNLVTRACLIAAGVQHKAAEDDLVFCTIFYDMSRIGYGIGWATRYLSKRLVDSAQMVKYKVPSMRGRYLRLKSRLYRLGNPYVKEFDSNTKGKTLEQWNEHIRIRRETIVARNMERQKRQDMELEILRQDLEDEGKSERAQQRLAEIAHNGFYT